MLLSLLTLTNAIFRVVLARIMTYSTGIPLLRFMQMRRTIENGKATIIADPTPIAATAPALSADFAAVSSTAYKQTI